MDVTDKSRKNWTREETLALLECYVSRKDEFIHSRKKKFAYSNVLEDLISRGILKSETTVAMISTKMQTLVRAYKAAKDNANQAGSGPCIGPFMEEMEEIFGDRPIIANTYTLNLCGDPISALVSFEESSMELVPPSPEIVPPTTSSFLESESMTPSTSSNASPTPINTKKRKITIEMYLAKKLELQEKEIEQKKLQRENLFKIREENAERRHKEKMELLNRMFRE